MQQALHTKGTTSNAYMEIALCWSNHKTFLWCMPKDFCKQIRIDFSCESYPHWGNCVLWAMQKSIFLSELTLHSQEKSSRGEGIYVSSLSFWSICKENLRKARECKAQWKWKKRVMQLLPLDRFWPTGPIPAPKYSHTSFTQEKTHLCYLQKVIGFH